MSYITLSWRTCRYDQRQIDQKNEHMRQKKGKGARTENDFKDHSCKSDAHVSGLSPTFSSSESYKPLSEHSYALA